jgi:hypothetical protein
MTVRQLFPTLLYQESIPPALVEELDHSVRTLAAEDGAGRRWSRAHGYRGYTSYASLNDLPRRDPAFEDLKRLLDRHVARFAEACAFDLGGRKLKLDSLWVNLRRDARRRGRAEAGGPAAADDDGRAHAPRRRARRPADVRDGAAGRGHAAAVGELAPPRGRGQCGKRRSDQRQLQLSVIVIRTLPSSA